jgi:hypothetical protein
MLKCHIVKTDENVALYESGAGILYAARPSGISWETYNALKV